MKQTIALILSFMFIFPAPVFAQEIIKEQPILLDIKKGQKSPFDGILLNPPAAAQILTTQKFTEKECDLRTEFELEKQKVKLELIIQTARLRTEYTETKYFSLLQIKNDEIFRLQELALERPNDYSHWWLSGGVVVGIALSLSVFAIAVEFK